MGIFPKLPFFTFDTRFSWNSDCFGRDSTKLTQLVKMKPKIFGKLHFRYFFGYLPNRRNNPARRKMVAGVENFRRSTTQKLLENMKKIFRSWSQRAQTLNKKTPAMPGC